MTLFQMCQEVKRIVDSYADKDGSDTDGYEWNGVFEQCKEPEGKHSSKENGEEDKSDCPNVLVE